MIRDGHTQNGPQEALERHGWVVTDAGCWEFSGARDRRGYGALRFSGKVSKAHRLAHEAWIGPIPRGAAVLHSCDNPPCINPAHLRHGSHAENMLDMAIRGRVGTSRLAEQDVLAVLADPSKAGIEWARELRVTPATISSIRTGKTWAHLRAPATDPLAVAP